MSHFEHEIHVCTECDRFWICKEHGCTKHIETRCFGCSEIVIPAPRARLLIQTKPISECEWI